MRSLVGTRLAHAAVALAFAGCAWLAPGPTADKVPDAGAKTPPPTARAAPVPQAPPEWRAGDHWVYEWTSGSESGTKSVTVVDAREIGGKAFYVLRLGDVEHYYTLELHWAAASREGRVEARMLPPQPWFAWPLAIGARWTHEGRFEQRGGTATHVDRFSVVGFETVEVPAGTYSTVKVVRETDRRDADEYWYAPDIRWYVRWVGRRGDAQFEERLREYHAASRGR